MALVARVVEHRALQYRRTFRASIFGSFVNPVLFLSAMGLGVGAYIDGAGNAPASLGDLTYLQFLGPGLLAATAMQSAAFESTFPVIGGMTWNRIYHAMFASPIGHRHVVLGTIAWVAIRLTMIAAIFTFVLAIFGAARSPLLILAIPAAVLTGLAFATPIAAYAATLRTPENFNAIFRFIITPLFLLSGTFFPTSQLPEPLQLAVWLSPLWHGVELSRALALGTAVDAPGLALVHVAVLAAIAVAGLVWCFRTFERRLIRG